MKKPLYLIGFIFFLMTFHSPVQAQLTRLNVGYSALSADQLPAWIARDSGIFAQNGLDVQTIFFTGGSTAILALVSGDVPITQVAGPGVVSSVLAGSDAVYVAAGVTSRNVVAPSMTRSTRQRTTSPPTARAAARSSCSPTASTPRARRRPTR